jgi:prepilin-type N-terminal cleavage/methylation domain-containing protein
MNPRLKDDSCRGFSFVEMLIVIAIMGLILAIGIPYFATVLHRSRVDAVAREIDIAVLSARLQAIKRGSNVGAVVSTDSSSAIGAYNTMIIFIDANANGILDGGETKIRTEPLFPAEHRVTLAIDAPDTSSPSASAATAYIVFTPFGSVGAGGDKGIYISDPYGNTLQVSVAAPASGKVALTKRVSGGTPPYQSPPWKWF